MSQISQPQEHRDLSEMLKTMRETTPEFTPDPITDENLLVIILNSIPLLSGLLGSASGTGKALINLVQYIKTTAQGVAVAGKVLGVAGVVADGLNFFRIPAVYLACFVLRIKPPFTLTNNLKFLYAAVVLALGVAGIFVAPGVALTLVSTAIGLGTVYNGYLFGKTIYDRYRLGKEIKELDSNIANGYIELENIKKIAAGLDEHTETVGELFKQYEQKSKEMQKWVNKKSKKQLERSKKNMLAILDEGVIAGLSVLAAVGVGLFLVNPVMGLTVLSGAGLVGLGYVAGRVITKAIYDYFNPDKSNEGNKLLELGAGEGLEIANRSEEKPVVDSGLNHESQNHVLAKLGSPHAVAAKNDIVDHFTKEISHAINQHDSPKQILLLFKEMALATEKYHTDDEFIKELFKDIPEWPERGAKMLNDALTQALDSNEPILTDEERAALISSQSLNLALSDYKIDLNRVNSESVKVESPGEELAEKKSVQPAPTPSDVLK